MNLMASRAWAEANPELMKQYRKDWYQKNKAGEIPKAAARNKQYRERNTLIIRAEKDKPCADCKIKYPYYVMHFDHLGEEDKDEAVGKMANRPVSESRLRAEIAKCEAVCANCHAERTYQRWVAQQHRGVAQFGRALVSKTRSVAGSNPVTPAPSPAEPCGHGLGNT